MNEKIILHKARIVVDRRGAIYKSEVLGEIVNDMVVRLSMVMPDPPSNLWSHDAPYVSITEHDSKNNTYLGEVLDIGRDVECNRYPVATGDSIWFCADNIIEIPLCEQSKNKAKKLKTFLTTEKVTVTGPLYTIIEDHLYDRENSSEHSYDSYSDNSDA